MSIDHIGLRGMKDLDAARAFYEKALAPLGYQVRMTVENAIGFGTSPCQPTFWIASTPPVDGGAHIAFKGTRDQVHAFYEEALKAGGKCNGPPGFRTKYHPFYYASFIIDPYGNNIEVVNHGSSWQWFWYIIRIKLGLASCDNDCRKIE